MADQPRFTSPAFDAVVAADHPSPDAGGPCATCAFRPGTEANRTEHTTMLAALCVEGLRPFQCHESPQLCRGFVAALNLRGAPQSDDERQWAEAAALGADIVGECIARAMDAERKATDRV